MVQGAQQSRLPTPVNPEQLESWLTGYDVALTSQIVTGFRTGFEVGYKGALPPVQSVNLKSALDQPAVVDKKLEKELELKRIAGPFPHPPFPSFRTSPLGLVAKKEPGKFRLIHHLSYPEGASINDGIPAEKSHVTYQSIDDAVAHMRELGRGCYLAKTDIADAFRIIPLHPSQYHLFGFVWRERYFYDRCLPMGCSASCQLFELISTALHWVAITKLQIQHMAHVLDDFLILEKDKANGKRKLDRFVTMCAEIGIPIAPEKTFPPSQVLTFLGYELDSQHMEIRLPLDKLTKCRHLIETCLKKQKIQLRDLQSIIGTLNFACGAVVPGRPFLRRLINLTVGVNKPFHYIRITAQVRDDLNTWLSFLSSHNGKSLLLPERWLLSPNISLFTDASGTLGYGAVLGPRWFYGRWNETWKGQSITLLEFYPIALAVQIWAEEFANKCICFHTDNEALVEILNTQTSKDVRIMHLLGGMVLTCLKGNILFRAKHIPGKSNILADALSRLQEDKFKELAPYAQPHPVEIPPLPNLPH